MDGQPVCGRGRKVFACISRRMAALTADPHAEAKAESSSEVLDQIAESKEAAKAAGLRYITDRRPGLHRVKTGSGFRYVDTDGKPVRDKDTLGRIKSLVIPPAWTDVWISPLANGHLQATGRDARGRNSR